MGGGVYGVMWPTKSTHKGNWKEITDKILDDIGITREDKVGKKHTTKRKTIVSLKESPGINKVCGRQKVKG